jgi:hypothetical protein
MPATFSKIKKEAGFLHKYKSHTVMTEKEPASLFQQQNANHTQHTLLSVI